MKVRLIKSWQTQLEDTIDAPYFDRLTDFVAKEYGQLSCYPPVSYTHLTLPTTPYV